MPERESRLGARHGRAHRTHQPGRPVRGTSASTSRSLRSARSRRTVTSADPRRRRGTRIVPACDADHLWGEIHAVWCQSATGEERGQSSCAAADVTDRGADGALQEQVAENAEHSTFDRHLVEVYADRLANILDEMPIERA